MEVAVVDGSVASSMDSSALVSSQSSGDEAAPGASAVQRVDKATVLKKRRTSVRKPRNKGILKKLQDQVSIFTVL